MSAEVSLNKLGTSGKRLGSQRSHDIEDNGHSQTNHHPGYGRGVGLGANSLGYGYACWSRSGGCWFWCRHEEVPKSVLIKVTGRSADSAEAPRRARPSKCYNRHSRQSRLSPTLVISVTSRHLPPILRRAHTARKKSAECFQTADLSLLIQKLRSAQHYLSLSYHWPRPSPGRSKLGGPPAPGAPAPSAGFGSSLGPTTASRVSLNFSKLSAEIT